MFRHTGLIVLALLLAGTLWAQPKTTQNVEKILNERANFSLKDITLEDAFNELGKQMGITVRSDDAALDMLPYGRQTRLNAVQFQGSTWRKGISELLKPLALRFEPGDKQILILGTDELMRQPDRLNLAELNTLVKLQNGGVNNQEKDLLKQLGQITGVNLGLVLESQRKDNFDPEVTRQILTTANQSAMRALDAYARLISISYPMTWVLDAGKNDQVDLVFLRSEQLIDRKMDRQIDFEYRNRPVQEIIIDLARRGGMNIDFEPGVLGMLDESVRNNTSFKIRANLRTAWATISGMTGLEYRFDRNGVYITASDNLKSMALARTSGGTRTNPSLLMLIRKIPGTDLEYMMFIREQDLKGPGLLDKYERIRQTQLDDFLKAIRAWPEPAPAVPETSAPAKPTAPAPSIPTPAPAPATPAPTPATPAPPSPAPAK